MNQLTDTRAPTLAWLIKPPLLAKQKQHDMISIIRHNIIFIFILPNLVLMQGELHQCEVKETKLLTDRGNHNTFCVQVCSGATYQLFSA